MAGIALDQADGQHPLLGQVGAGVHHAFRYFYPDYTDENDLFRERISRWLNKDAVVLDAGAGSGELFSYRWKDQVRLLVGCDVGSAISRNANLSTGTQAQIGQLPFQPESFDVIFARYVLEHIENPAGVFAEFARVLKPGGKLIVLTPSKYHYVTLISRATPHWFHELVNSFRGIAAEDTFPTRYVANSRKELTRYALEAGLTLTEFTTKEVCPNYLLWSLPSFLLGVVYERIVNSIEMLEPFRVSIVAVLERRDS